MGYLGEPVRMGGDNCPYCNKFIDTASCSGHEAKPGPGDFSVCIGCAGIMKYGKDMALEEFPAILIDTLELEFKLQLLDLVETVKKVNAKYKSTEVDK